jgi:hypothetical protein
VAKREVDKRKTAKALRKLRRAAERAGQEGAPELTTWEKEFVEGVTERLETYGSAFRDPGKGRLEEALSARQTHVVRVIDKKSRPRAEKLKSGGLKSGGQKPSGRKTGKPKDDKPGAFHGSTLKRTSTFRSKGAPPRSPRVRDVNDDLNDVGEPATPTSKRAAFHVIVGGKPVQKSPKKPV